MSALPCEFGEERGIEPTDDNRDVFGDPEWQAWARFASSQLVSSRHAQSMMYIVLYSVVGGPVES